MINYSVASFLEAAIIIIRKLTFKVLISNLFYLLFINHFLFLFQILFP